MAANAKLVTVSWRERERDVLAPTLEIREQKRVLSLAEWEKHI